MTLALNNRTSAEFKIKFAKEALASEAPIDHTSRKYGIPYSTGWVWVDRYRRMGDEAFASPQDKRKKKKIIRPSVSTHASANVAEVIRKEQNNKSFEYLPEFRLMVAMHALVHDKTQSKLAYEFGISQSKVSEWKRRLEDEGPKMFSTDYRPEVKTVIKEEEFDYATWILYGFMCFALVFIYCVSR